MGKRARKTRWRALDIADEHSDSEESNTNSSAVSSRNSRSYTNGYYSKYPYSSQSTPARRRYNHQFDGSAKSTRSSSTTSETKITFNEDEYTRITTPRQDVLFKKGYLNKPKTYHTQTSTGNSTVSTGNSTENGTPDHQSTDLDYESQFMFPNGFVDSNGIYYVNSYEPYPLMLFNPPTYYHECSNIKSKRMSTGSLSESMSPNNEETASQDLSPSGGDVSNNVSDYSGGPPVFNMVFPGYYVNGACTPTDLTNSNHYPQEPVKKLKKRRERKSSKNIQEDSSEYTDENSGDESHEGNADHQVCPVTTLPIEHTADSSSRLTAPSLDVSTKVQEVPENEAQAQERDSKEELKTVCETSNPSDNTLSNGCADAKTESNDEKPDLNQAQPNSEDYPKHSALKPDAEEFIPRAYHNLGPPPPFKMLSPNFMPIPLVPISDFGGQNFAPHPAFIPPGVPINFIPHHPGQKFFPPVVPGFVNFAPSLHETKIEENTDKNEEACTENKAKESTATPAHTPVVEESKPFMHSKVIDIATVVSKLEAVKQQEKEENVAKEEVTSVAINETKPFIGSPRFKRPANFKRNFYNKYRSSPIRSGEASPQNQNGGNSPLLQDSPYRFKNPPVCSSTISPPQKQMNVETSNHAIIYVQHVEASSIVENGRSDQSKFIDSPVNDVEVSLPVQNKTNTPSNHANSSTSHCKVLQPTQNANVTEKLSENRTNHASKVQLINSIPSTNDSNKIRNSPERFKKNWNPNGYQNVYHNHYQNGARNSRRVHNYQDNHNQQKSTVNEFGKLHTGDLISTPNKNYSATVKKAQIISASSVQSKKHINIDKPLKTVENIADAPLKSELVKPKSNQWISVFNRKKKKNKNAEEVGFDTDQDVLDESAQSDNVCSDFEVYDVRKLVDVVPPSQIEQNLQGENKIEDILSIIAQNESSEVLANGRQTPTDFKIPAVSDIEKDIIVKIEEQKEVPCKTPNENLPLNLQIVAEKDELVTAKEVSPLVSDDQKEEILKSKKKPKKSTQKPLTKKVIITDVDLSMVVTEVKTPIKKVVTRIEEVKSTSTVQAAIVAEKTNVVKEITPEIFPEQTEKKSKKKKKNKTCKSTQIENSFESNGTSSISDNSYEFLLESDLLNESPEKTNDDISFELEKLIQKGMYSSLQEKIKSINVEPEADGFFKSFQAVSSPGKDKPATANGFMQTPDFNRIFQSTRQFLKPNMTMPIRTLDFL